VQKQLRQTADNFEVDSNWFTEFWEIDNRRTNDGILCREDWRRILYGKKCSDCGKEDVREEKQERIQVTSVLEADFGDFSNFLISLFRLLFLFTTYVVIFIFVYSKTNL
jgi:hypothetical protein